LIVSISTKDKDFTTYIPILNRIQKAVSLTGGFVKIGISFTNINYEYLEEGTATFEERISLLRMLSEYEFKLSAVIKPLLPFVTVDEYKVIIKQSDADKYLLGGLYVEEGSEFYNVYIKDKFKVTHRTVEWLNDERHLYVESDETQLELIRFINSIGKSAYSSDIEMINSWL
jgi:DNA repair photolyase